LSTLEFNGLSQQGRKDTKDVLSETRWILPERIAEISGLSKEMVSNNFCLRRKVMSTDLFVQKCYAFYEENLDLVQENMASCTTQTFKYNKM